MSVCVPLVPAEGLMAGLPAHAQLATPAQPAEPQQPVISQRRSSVGKSRGKGKYKLTRGRRARDDTWPGFSGNEAFDVERLWHWVNRGAHKKSQRMCPWKGEKMDVEQAYRLLQQERELGLDQQCLRGLNAPMALPQVAQGMPQPANYLQGFGSGFQDPSLPSLQASVPPQQGPFTTGHSGGGLTQWGQGYQGPPFQQMQATMPAQPFPVGVPQYADNLQGQAWGFQDPTLQQVQAPQPAPQLPLLAGHGPGSLLDFPQQYTGFSGAIDGLQSQSSSSGSPGSLGLHADNSSVELPSGSSQSSLPSAPMLTEDPLAQYTNGASSMDFVGMGAWNQQPAVNDGGFLPSNAGFNDFSPLEFPSFDLEGVSPLEGAEEIPVVPSLSVHDSFWEI